MAGAQRAPAAREQHPYFRWEQIGPAVLGPEAVVLGGVLRMTAFFATGRSAISSRCLALRSATIKVVPPAIRDMTAPTSPPAGTMTSLQIRLLSSFTEY